MAGIPLPNGAKLALATTLGAAKVISGISNLNPAVITSANNQLAANAVVLLSVPAWSGLDNAVRRVGAVAADAVPLPGYDATDVVQNPALEGVGTLRAITGWTSLPKVPSLEKTGGEPKTAGTDYVDVEKEREFFTGTSAERLNFTLSYQPDSAAHAALIKAAASGEICVLSLTLKDGSVLYYSGYLHYNPTPTTSKDNEMRTSGSMALQADITRFAKAP